MTKNIALVFLTLLLTYASPSLADNTIYGTAAGGAISTGVSNVALGENAMHGVSATPLTGSYNVGIGTSTLSAIQGAGAYNTGVGNAVLPNLSTGSSNTAIGLGAGNDVTTGTDNTLVGFEAGVDVTGSHNVILGEDDGAISSGSSNILIGNGLTEVTNTTSNQIDIGDTILVLNDTHITTHGSGTSPTISGTCTGCSIAGNDNAMVITIGSTAYQTVTVNFNKTWAGTPVCTASTNGASGVYVLGITTLSTTQVAVETSASHVTVVIYVNCHGYK
jgi:hypothetical protein